MDLDVNYDIQLVMLLSTESIGGGECTKPADGYTQWNQKTAQKLAIMPANIQLVATSTVSVS